MSNNNDQIPEDKAWKLFMDRMKASDDAGALKALESKFPEGSDYAGEDLFVYINDCGSPIPVLFLSIHYGCQSTFEALKEVMQGELFDGYSDDASELYFVQRDQYSNLGDDQALADQIANGMVPDLWPVPDDPNCFGVPSRTYGWSIDIDNVNFDEIRNLTVLKDDKLEALVSEEVVKSESIISTEVERLAPDEFGDRSRRSDMMTLVYKVEL
ncbi:MAG: hypothetical protein QNL01_13520 [Akkermansiaceae bacterium]